MKVEQIKAKALELGFHQVGVASYPPPDLDLANQRLQAWLDSGYQAEMNWMANPKRWDANLCLEGVKSIISVALNYYTEEQRPEGQEYAKVARYGWGRDYHKVMSKKLKALGLYLERQDPGIRTRYYVDTGPISDKAWAQRAGLGWIGKNGNLITRKYGSWVFLGEILTNLDLVPDQPHSQHCGTCTRCLEACPTQAITQPFVVDANLCIAYHTIENRSPALPDAIAASLDGWVAGCDICQDVCPWNQRFAQPTDVVELSANQAHLNSKLVDISTMTEEQWDQQFTSSALRRIKPFQWRRNAQANLDYHPHNSD